VLEYPPVGRTAVMGGGPDAGGGRRSRTVNGHAHRKSSVRV
jgi:hypothetical protein